MVLAALFQAIVNVMASTTAAVLSHPLVKDAAAEVIVAGMNAFLRQDDLDAHLEVMIDTLSKRQNELARKQGEDFPVLVQQFMKGVMGRPPSVRLSKTDADAALQQLEQTVSLPDDIDDEGEEQEQEGQEQAFGEGAFKFHFD